MNQIDSTLVEDWVRVYELDDPMFCIRGFVPRQLLDTEDAKVTEHINLSDDGNYEYVQHNDKPIYGTWKTRVDKLMLDDGTDDSVAVWTYRRDGNKLFIGG